MTDAITLSLVAACVLSLVGWDIYLALNKREGDTISERVRQMGRVSQMMPWAIGFVMGLLVGHWYW